MQGVGWRHVKWVVDIWANLTPRPVRARGSAEESWIDRLFGVHPTASPSAYACDAATAFLAAISLAFWRIRSAKRGT